MPKRVLIIAPHPDDEVLGCGGSIANHVAAGHDVRVLYLTSGERGSPDIPAAALGPHREREAWAAMLALDVPAERLRFARIPDGRLDPGDLDQLGIVVGVLRKLLPDLLYLPHADEASYDHRAANALCWRAVGMAASRNFPEWGEQPHWVSAVLAYEVWSPIGEPSYTEDITTVISRKLAALACYDSQSSRAKGEGQATHVGPATSHLSAFRGAITTGGHREAFVVLRISRVTP